MKTAFLSAFVVLVILEFKNSYAAKQNIVLTGRPGYGKTSSVRKIVEFLDKEKIPYEGYTTNAVMKGLSRVGFEIMNCKTKEKVQFAHIAYSYTGTAKVRIGQYVVDVDIFDTIAKPIFKAVMEGNATIILVMDEMGRMESASPYYNQALTEVLHNNNTIILGTCTSKGAFINSFSNITNEDRFSFLPIALQNRTATPYDVSRMLVEMYKARLNG